MRINFKIHYLVRLTAFWFLFFALFRVLFIVYHHAKIPDGQHSETSLSFFYALPLDLSMICAILLIPYILWSLQQFYKTRTIHRINLGFNFLIIILVSVLSVFNLKMYGEYSTLLSTQEFANILYPKEPITFLSLWSLLIMLVASGLLAMIGIRAYRKYITNFSHPIENKVIKITLVSIIPFALLVGFRGGFQAVPIDKTAVDYSELQINNDIATNTIWYLGHSFLYNADALKNN